LSIGDEAAVDDVGEASFEAPQKFQRGLAGGELASEIAPTLGVVTELNDRGDMDHVVHSPVAGLGQTVADLLPGGGVQRCGAGPGGEPAPAGR